MDNRWPDEAQQNENVCLVPDSMAKQLPAAPKLIAYDSAQTKPTGVQLNTLPEKRVRVPVRAMFLTRFSKSPHSSLMEGSE